MYFITFRVSSLFFSSIDASSKRPLSNNKNNIQSNHNSIVVGNSKNGQKGANSTSKNYFNKHAVGTSKATIGKKKASGEQQPQYQQHVENKKTRNHNATAAASVASNPTIEGTVVAGNTTVTTPSLSSPTGALQSQLESTTTRNPQNAKHRAKKGVVVNTSSNNSNNNSKTLPPSVNNNINKDKNTNPNQDSQFPSNTNNDVQKKESTNKTNNRKQPQHEKRNKNNNTALKRKKKKNQDVLYTQHHHYIMGNNLPLTQQQLTKLKPKAVAQVEYFFSTTELAKNVFLRKYMDCCGYVPFAFIYNFPSIMSFRIPYMDLLSAVNDLSHKVEVDFVNECVRIKGTSTEGDGEEYKKWLFPNLDGSFGCPRWIKEITEEEQRELSDNKVVERGGEEKMNNNEKDQMTIQVEDTSCVEKQEKGVVDEEESSSDTAPTDTTNSEPSITDEHQTTKTNKNESRGRMPELSFTDSDSDNTDGENQ